MTEEQPSNITEENAEGIQSAHAIDIKQKIIQALTHYAFLLGIAGVIVSLDQWTKGLVERNLAVGETWMPWDWLSPYARIVHWWNTGSAFGLFPQASTFFTILAIVVILIILYYFPRVPRHEWALRLAMALQFSGALGNLIDRLTIGHVTDFISLGSFPVFNIADSCISLGVAVLIFGLWWEERKAKREAAANAFLDGGELYEEEGI